MQPGDLVRSRRAHYLVLNVPSRLDQIFVQVVKTGNKMWLNKSALEIVSATR